MNASKKILCAAMLSALAVSPAFADKGGKGHGGGHGGGHDDDRDRVVQVERGHRDDRVVIVDDHARGCPPGLAKKNNGCLPPGQAKKMDRVIVGQALPPGAVYVIPQRIRTTLPPAPAGYRYAVVDNQVVLVSSGNIVVDIIRSILG